MKSPLTGTLTAVAVDVGDTTPNLVIISTFTNGINPGQTTGTCVNDVSHNCPFDTSGQGGYTIQDTESITISSASFSTIVLNNPVSVNNGQWISATFLVTGGGIPPLQTCDQNCGTGGGTPINGVTSDTALAFGTNNPQVGATPSTSGQTGGCGCVISGTFQSTATTGGTVTVTQCYGNCGSPPITLVNTNSTHTINFNQTITLFYEFQSNVNGFLLNVTTSLAKSYVTLPNGPSFGVYTIPNCPLGNLPFSAQCPGLLQTQSAGTNTFSPPKGKISLTTGSVPVFNGQWVGIALSAFLSGLDVNDTNTNVNLFQTNEGKIPAVIQAPQTLGNSKVGLWAWVRGNVVTGSPPSSPGLGACPGLDCILNAVVNSSCSVVTAACQTGSGLFWVIILTVITLTSVLASFSYIMPNVGITTRGIGEFAILIFVGWFAVFGAFGLILPWLMILMFFVIAWLFLGRARGTGPI